MANPLNDLGRTSAEIRTAAGGAKRFSYAPTGREVGSLLQPNKMRALLTGHREQIMSPDYVLPRGPGSDLLGNRLAMAQSTVGGGPTPAPLAPSFSATDEERMNTTMPLNREYFVPPPGMGHSGSESALLELPSVYELAAIHIPRDSGRTLRVQGSFGGNSSRHGATYEHAIDAKRNGSAVLMQDKPLVALNPIALNKFLAEEQYALLRTNPERYRRLTPHEIWYGCELPWTGWCWDGVVSIERSAEGRSTRDSDDWHSNAFLGRGVMSGSRGKSKIVTTVAAGQHEVLDIVEGRGLQEGAVIYTLLTKTKLGGVNGQYHGYKQRYVLSHKAAPNGIPVAGHVYDFVADSVDALNTLPSLKNPEMQLKESFKPFQIVAVAEPSGASLHTLFNVYTDEWGCEHSDGLSQPQGRVLFAPIQYDRKMPLRGPEDVHFKPLTEGHELMIRQRMTLVLNKARDGIFAGC